MKARKRTITKLGKMSPAQLISFFVEAERMILNFERRPATRRKGFSGDSV